MSSDEGLLPGCFRFADLASWLINPSRTMTTRSASVTARSSSQPVRITHDGEGLARTADADSDHSSSYEVDRGQGTNHRQANVVFSERDVDDISLVGGSTVDSLLSLQKSSAACSRSEDFFPPAGVGQKASALLDAGAPVQLTGSVSLGDHNLAAAVSLPTGPQPSIHRPRTSRSIRPPECTSVGQPVVSASSAHVRDEASDVATAAILASQMGPTFGACYFAVLRTVQRARRQSYESLLTRMKAMAVVSLSIASTSVDVEALLPTTARSTRWHVVCCPRSNRVFLKEAHFDSSTAFAIEASAVCKSYEFGAVVLATLAAPLTVWSSKVLAVNSVSFLADALQTLLLAAIYSALASSARVAFAVSGSEAVEYIDPGYDPPVLVCC